MHRLAMLTCFAMPALALVAGVAHAKWGFSPLGFSSGN